MPGHNNRRIYFYSDGIRYTNDTPLLGKKHYSYQIPAERFRQLFANSFHLPLPEIFTDKALQIQYGKDITDYQPGHLIFRSFHDIRLLKGAINIAHIPWEFRHLALRKRPGEVWDQLSLLKKLHEVWTPSSFSQRVLQNHLDLPVRFVPTPIPSSCSPVPRTEPYRAFKLHNLLRLPATPVSIFLGQDGRATAKLNIAPLGNLLPDIEKRRLFLAVLNPGDFRKDIETLLRGFKASNADSKNYALIIKLVIDNEKTTLVNVQNDTISPKFLDKTGLSSPNIVFISESLSQSELHNLYEACDFYICTSRGEGQNLPLLEAMGCGVIPISVSHTSMEDFITSDTAFIIRSWEVDLYEPELTQFTEDGWSQTYETSTYETAKSINQALTADHAYLTKLQENAISLIGEKYSSAAVRRLVEDSPLCIYLK